jgi:hypothetical protein
MKTAAMRRIPGYYKPHDYADEGDLNVEWERPGFDVPGEFMVEYVPGRRERLIIEGKGEYVRRLERAMAEELETIRTEIEEMAA